ncbi:MAG: hypothetical protein LUO89_16195 [Methanothrix sp.]|nr:hypothetical protein [Methanothrix sp.]
MDLNEMQLYENAENGLIVTSPSGSVWSGSIKQPEGSHAGPADSAGERNSHGRAAGTWFANDASTIIGSLDVA